MQLDQLRSSRDRQLRERSNARNVGAVGAGENPGEGRGIFLCVRDLLWQRLKLRALALQCYVTGLFPA